MKKSNTHDLIRQQVRRIPRGKVATYGQIARLAGLDGHARLVGYAMHALPPNSGIPWHRVINSQGRISLTGPSARRQQALLEAEQIEFSPALRVNLKKFQWKK